MLVRFCDIHNFYGTLHFSNYVLDCYKGIDNLKWYFFLRSDSLDDREDDLSGCKIINIKTISTVNAELFSFLKPFMIFIFKLKQCIVHQRFRKIQEEDFIL